jgi:hypothetical protein
VELDEQTYSLNNRGELVQKAIGVMEFWAENPPDFVRGKETLETLYGRILKGDKSTFPLITSLVEESS